MESQLLYKVEKEDLTRVKDLLSICFQQDMLYRTLIPDPETRERLLPELMKCDVEEALANCEIFADSKDLNAALIVSDESEPYNPLRYYLEEMFSLLKTEGYVIREDPSLKTLFNFIKGKDYLNESWADQLHRKERVHIIYLAVDPEMQHMGFADLLMNETLFYASSHGLMVSLETHNPDNVDMYRHYGFKVYGILEKEFGLKQYCMIHEV